MKMSQSKWPAQNEFTKLDADNDKAQQAFMDSIYRDLVTNDKKFMSRYFAPVQCSKNNNVSSIK